MRAWTAVLILALTTIPGSALGDIYHWVDEKGIQYYTTSPESIPERYRSAAQPLSMPTPPPAPPALESSASRGGFTRIPFAPGSPVLVRARINGAGFVTLILDTGADHTLISPAALGRLGVPTAGVQRGVLKGVTGTSYANAVWIGSVEVGEAKTGPLLVIVHDAGLHDADGLLGRDFLASFNVTIDSRERVVTLTPN